jgi:O-antigen/teichoic acid export membrane protein
VAEESGDVLGVFRGHAALYLGSNVLPAILGFASVFVFVRLFGTETYGRFGVGVGIALTGASYGVGWVVQGILRFQTDAAASGRARVFAGTVGSLALAATAVACVPALILLLRIRGGNGSLVLMSLAVLAASSCYQVFFAVTQAQLQPRRLLWAESAKAILFVGLPLVLLWQGHAGTTPLLGGMLAGYIAGAVILATTDVRLERPDRATAVALWQFGWPIGLWLGCSQLLSYSDRYLIAHYYGYDAAGAYASVFDLVRKGFIVALSPITLAVHPLLVRLWEEKRYAESRSVLKHAMQWQLGLGVLGIIILVLATPIVGRLLLAERAAEGSALILPIGVGSVLWTAARLAHKPLELLKRTRVMLWILTGAAALTLLLELSFLPVFGPVAAAWATVAGSGAYLAAVWTVQHRARAAFSS